MCGIAGLWNYGDDEVSLARSMAGRLAHRGPDASQVLQLGPGMPSLVHTRLAIQDLSEAGSQPMTSRSGNYSIVFNGEIYNHNDLRTRLSDVDWKGHSDTETLIQYIETFGLSQFLSDAEGMFAFALWDSAAQTLQLVRDRFGEKPLYYLIKGSRIAFASEIAALEAIDNDLGKVDPQAVQALLEYSYIPSPATIYHAIKKVRPGTVVTLAADARIQFAQYWSAVEEARKQKGSHNSAASLEGLENVITRSVQQQMIGDTPVGAFLSGGVDSSLIVALMRRFTDLPVCTYSIGFKDRRYDESEYARSVANYLGTTHFEKILEAQDLLAMVNEISAAYSEPFADPSQLPTLLLARHAAEGVKVCLSGDGGDELFGGYRRYYAINSVISKARFVPSPFRRVISSILQGATPERLAGLSKIPGLKVRGNTITQLNKIGSVLSAGSVSQAYEQIVKTPLIPGMVLGQHPSSGLIEEVDDFTPIEQMMLNDICSYMAEGILVKVDRASMAYSLEVRAPFLSRQVFEYAWRLGDEQRVNATTGKVMLRELLKKHIPQHLVDRPKMGFGIPLSDWLKHDLEEWGNELLGSESLLATGILDARLVQKIWQDHKLGKVDHSTLLWNVLMFVQWHQKRLEGIKYRG